jgi:hypothetical protein
MWLVADKELGVKGLDYRFENPTLSERQRYTRILANDR